MRNSNNKILTIAVVLLLLANIALVVFLLKGNKCSARPEAVSKVEPSEVMIKELGMTEQQQADYKRLKEEHMKNIKPLIDSVRAAKLAFYALIKHDNISDSTLKVYDQQITNRQTLVDMATFAHFQRARKIFSTEQQPKFDEFVQKMVQRWRKDSTSTK